MEVVKTVLGSSIGYFYGPSQKHKKHNLLGKIAIFDALQLINMIHNLYSKLLQCAVQCAIFHFLDQN